LSNDLINQKLYETLIESRETEVYAVLDGAAASGLIEALYDMKPEFFCLFRGKLTPDIAETAPYLVNMTSSSEFTDWVFDEGWGKSWGIFATADADIKTMRRHFRTFLTVVDPDGESIHFRYYDPRVFSVYLPTCNAEELGLVFGPIESYYMEGETPDTLLSFTCVKDACHKESIDLSS